MELKHVTDFRPEVACKLLEETPPRELMVIKLEDHKAEAGEHAQSQVLSRGSTAVAPLGVQGLAHSSCNVQTQRQLKPMGVQQGQAVTAQGEALDSQEKPGLPAPLQAEAPGHWPCKDG